MVRDRQKSVSHSSPKMSTRSAMLPTPSKTACVVNSAPMRARENTSICEPSLNRGVMSSVTCD
jgi:hypothetical protein